jgi:holin-like protein
MRLIPFLITLLVCQLIGEITVMTFGLPLPGPVVGMAVLFSWLAVAGKRTGNFALLSNQLLSHLSLLFVPAGVGVMLHAELLGEELVPIAVALVVSTLATLALTAWIMNKLGAEHGES